MKDDAFLNSMKEFQGREKATAIRDSILAIKGVTPEQLQALEAMVGITPEMISKAKTRWAEEQAKMGDAVVEVHSTQA